MCCVGGVRGTWEALEVNYSRIKEVSTKVHNPGTRDGQAQLNGLLSSQQPSYVLRSTKRACEILLAPDRICHHAVLSRLPVSRTHISVLLHDMV